VKQYFPFLDWISSYRKSYLLNDIMAGLTVGIVLVPQGMAYAMIAGLPPVYGLYASLFPVLTYALLGTSRKIAVGPVAMDSLLVAAGLSTLSITGVENYIAMVMVLALMVGAFQFMFGVFKMGFLVNFLSKPVISGFTSAAAIIIIGSQLKHLIGISITDSNSFIDILPKTFSKLNEINFYDFAIGLFGIVAIIIGKKWLKKWPMILLIVVLGIAVVYFFELADYGVKLVGEVPRGIPSLRIPDVSLVNLLALWPIALALALVGYLEAISIGKALEEKSGEDTISPNKELIALGSTNIVASFFQGYPVTASFSRSAINLESGAKTNLAGIVSVVLVILSLLFLTPLFQYLPNAILASIIMVSVFGLIDISYVKKLWKLRKDEFWVLIITFLVTILLGITEGIVVGVLLSLLLLVYRTSKPHFAELGNIKGSDYFKNIKRFGDEVVVRNDLLVVRFDSELYFGNITFFKNQLLKMVEQKGSELQAIVLNAEAINYIDATAVDALTKLIMELHQRNLDFYIASATGPVRDIIFSSGIINELHVEYLFAKTKEAVDCFDNPNSVTAMGARIAAENKYKD
jgi:SulP family sulfate permease